MGMYESFARVYDTFMDDVPYEEWGRCLTRLLKEQGIGDGLVLDLGCGTGAMTRLLAGSGYDMIGVDSSPDMLQIASEKGFTVHLFEAGNRDHVHCFVSAPPKLSITDIVKYLKGITGRKLFEAYPEIRGMLWKGQLWNHSYYVETVGSVSEDAIRQYIEKQSKAY